MIEVEDRLYLRLDPESRWTAFGEGGAFFRRTVDGRVLVPRGEGFETLGEDRACAVDAWVVRRAGEVLEALREAPEAAVRIQGDPTELVARLERSACGAPPSPARDRERFGRVYPEPVPILPPHRYRDVVVMPATGCPNHTCRFCAFYRDRPFRVVAPEIFAAHLEAVRDLFGEALAARDGIFLGSASALSLSDDVLLDRLAAVERVLGRPRRGVASFFDPDRGRLRSARAWARLGEAGLVEATVGLETGLEELRCEMGKSADLDRFRETVGRLKAGGLTVSATVLIGVGGAARAREHRRATVALLARMPLESRDRVYLAPLVGGGAPAVDARAEAERFRADLARATPARVGDYRIQRFAWLG